MSLYHTGVRKGVAVAEDRAIATRLRAVRLSQGVSQVDLGLALGVSFQQIQKYERCGNRISAGRLVLAARALEVDVSTFFEGLVDPAQEGDAAMRLTFGEVIASPHVSQADVRDMRAYLALSTELRRALGVIFGSLGCVHDLDAERTVVAATQISRCSG